MEIKQLPQSVEAEQSVIGSLLKDNSLICDIAGILKPDDFYDGRHNLIYKTIFEMYRKNTPFDTVTLINQLGKDNIQAVGGITYISELYTSVATTQNFKSYVQIIKEKSDRRRIILNCHKALEKAYSTEIQTNQIIGQLEDELFDVSIDYENKILSDSELMEATLNMVEKNYENGGEITGISTGYKSLDNAINGLIKGDLVIIAARPSMGKTSLSLNITNNVPKNRNVVLFEMEMSAEKLGTRRLAAKSFINATNLPKGKLSEREWEIATNKASAIANKNNVYTDTTSSQTVQSIKAKCKKLKIQHGLDIAIIDYIGLIIPNNPKDSRTNQVSQITRDLKSIAKDLNICVIALSQLSRAPEQRADHRPILADLRDSGSIEQDADLVMFLYRDEYYNKNSKDQGILECIIAKQRDGRTGTIKLSYQPQFQLITELYR